MMKADFMKMSHIPGRTLKNISKGKKYLSLMNHDVNSCPLRHRAWQTMKRSKYAQKQKSFWNNAVC
jgi:hypothetical protein